MGLVRHITIVDVDGRARDVRVRVGDDHATVGDLLRVAGVDRTDAHIDGRAVPTTATLDEARLRDGAVVRIGPAPLPRRRLEPDDDSVVALDQIAGLTSGGTLGLAPGHYGFGPALEGGPLLRIGELDHAAFELAVGDDGSATLHPTAPGLELDGLAVAEDTHVGTGVIDAGTARFALADPAPMVPRTPAERSFHRAPRRLAAEPDDRVHPPTLPGPPADPPGLSWIMLVAPLPPALLMAVLFHPRFALFAAFGPVLTAARWLEGRRTHRAGARRSAAASAAAIATFTNDVIEVRRAVAAHRRTLDPSPSDVRRRARTLDPRLWERRPRHDDFACVAIGYGTAPWQPDLTGSGRLDDELRSVADRLAGLPSVPIRADLRTGPLGIVGPRTDTLAVARAVISALGVLSSPDDLPLSLVTSPERAADWDWLKWLPHLGRPRRVASSAAAVDDLVASLAIPDEPGHHLGSEVVASPLPTVVVDGIDELHRRGSPLRRALSDSTVAGIVVGDTLDRLPASCRWILELGDAEATFHDLDARTSTPVTPTGTSVELATDTARALAWLTDPDAPAASGGALPDRVLVPELFDGVSAADVARRWAAGGPDPDPVVPIGVAESGPLVVDLATDGPHALLAGTTGAGKSEFLRSFVIGLAANHSTETLNVVLVDYKGGGAFDACADLPHTVAIVTDLDDHLGERALRSLQAELRHRELRFREAGAHDLHAFRAAGQVMPRLVVVVDEFATLAAELPEFLDALVDIAQRGRSLGIHLVLATQRPAGVLDGKIRANTNLRISLRVQDENDALDVVGVTAPAHLGRRDVGRGYARLAASEVVAFQSAWSGGRSSAAGLEGADPFTLLADIAPADTGAAAAPDRDDDIATTPVDLERMVAAVMEAHRATGHATPRRPWLPALPTTLPLPAEEAAAPHPTAADPGVAHLGTTETSGVVIGLRDLPHEQRRDVVRFDPELGHALVYGVDGATTANTLATVGLRLAATNSADELHLHVVDDASRRLAGLGALPHTGAVVSADDDDMVRRLIDLLGRRLDERRAEAARGAAAASRPRIVLLVEGLGAWFEQATESGRADAIAAVQQLLRDGPALGLTVVGSARHDRAIPVRILNQIQTKFVHRLADPAGLATFGLRPRELPLLSEHQVIDAATGDVGTMISVPDLSGTVAAIAAATPTPARRPDQVRVLGTTVTLDELETAARLDGRRVVCPVGLSPDDVSTVELVIDPMAVVVGAPGSGRTSTLGLLLDRVAAAGVDPSRCLLVADDDSPLVGLARQRFGDEIVTVLAPDADPDALGEGAGRVIVVDDVDRVGTKLGAAVEAVAAESASGCFVLAAGRAEDLTSMMAWTKVFRTARAGVLLQPRPSDGDVFRVVLPFRTPQVFPTGRAAVLVNGVVQMCQLAEVGEA